MHTPVPTWVKFEALWICRTATFALVGECVVDSQRMEWPYKARASFFCIDYSVAIE
jgi:hypothetical protein